jgi:hypothetical protein
MAGSLSGAIAYAYRDPRGAMGRILAEGPGEARALAWLLLACLLYWLAGVPRTAEEAAGVPVEDPLTAILAAKLFGLLVLAPLVFYGMAALLHLGARAAGGAGSFAAARAALFWTLLLGAPMALALAALGAVEPAVPVLAAVRPTLWLGYAALGWWLWLLAAALAEAEGFRRARPLAAGFGIGCVLIAAGVAALLPAGAAGP